MSAAGIGASGPVLFPRKFSLVVTSPSEQDDLSALRCKFKVNQSDLQSPNNVICKVYNLGDALAQKIQKEFTKITISAGYDGAGAPYGIIFDGTVRNYGKGSENQLNPIRINRESPTETYLEINAGEGDDPYNSSTINKTLAAGYTDITTVSALAQSMGLKTNPFPENFGANLSIRGKVMFGMSRDYMRQTTIPNGSRWNIGSNGTAIQIIANEAYLPGQEVVLNSQTGMIGMPEQTPDGIIITCLLNPKIQIGGTVRINNADVVNAGFAPEYTAFNFPPPKSADGTYRVLVAEHEGDTRGDTWYTYLTCVSVSTSSAPNSAVQPYGGAQ